MYVVHLYRHEQQQRKSCLVLFSTRSRSVVCPQKCLVEIPAMPNPAISNLKGMLVCLLPAVYSGSRVKLAVRKV
jgi:hypothetical protein